ncbi:MAG TPA: hypothetical protein VNC84_03025 [Gammaproteobacteria bacterium]|jgi:hypothetical protein|nr:hypothetical protein [Gammaproteobacteria bacterium]
MQARLLAEARSKPVTFLESNWFFGSEVLFAILFVVVLAALSIPAFMSFISTAPIVTVILIAAGVAAMQPVLVGLGYMGFLFQHYCQSKRRVSPEAIHRNHAERQPLNERTNVTETALVVISVPSLPEDITDISDREFTVTQNMALYTDRMRCKTAVYESLTLREVEKAYRHQAHRGNHPNAPGADPEFAHLEYLLLQEGLEKLKLLVRHQLLGNKAIESSMYFDLDYCDRCVALDVKRSKAYIQVIHDASNRTIAVSGKMNDDLERLRAMREERSYESGSEESVEKEAATAPPLLEPVLTKVSGHPSAVFSSENQASAPLSESAKEETQVEDLNATSSECGNGKLTS